LHGREHAGDADAVGDEVGRVFGAHHALAQHAGHKDLELIEHQRPGAWGGDELDQRHVARRVEEVDAAKARAQSRRQYVGERADRQPRGVRGQQRAFGDKGRDLGVELALPVHALGDGLDDQVAAAQALEVLLVVGGLDQLGVVGHTQRRGLELFEVGDGAVGDGVQVARARIGLGQIEQNDRHLAVDQVRRDLRPHHTGAEHGDLFDLKSAHGMFLALKRAAVTGREPRSGCGQRGRWSRALAACAPLRSASGAGCSCGRLRGRGCAHPPTRRALRLGGRRG